jgi:putative AdoMet-dependent methyltransferase
MSNTNSAGIRWNWRYDELKQIGTDYRDAAEVENYDIAMQSIRNVPREIQDILSLLKLGDDQTVLEIGTGTGEFAIAASRHCSKVIATDVSQAMLDYAGRKAMERGAGNIDFKLAGFLTYDHSGPDLDAVITQLALHHLPDFWKQVAILRIHDMLKDGGKLYLMDVVYSFDCRNYQEFFDNYIAGAENSSGNVDMVSDIACHIREEHSTYSWVMEGMLKHAGFKIEVVHYVNGFIATYLCTKEKRSLKSSD